MTKTIPARGRPWEALSAELEAAKQGDYAWKKGRVPLYVYWLNEELARVQQQAYEAYWSENALGMRAFPSLKRLEDEVIGMGLSLLHAPDGAGATFTSGGSESIFLALRAAREKARIERGIETPNIVIPQTAHLTFNRAAMFQQIEVRRIPTGANFQADVAGMEEAIDDNTVALVGSAPNYPFGVVDPIDSIASLAASRGLWMHVDACVGGFLAPWAKRLGEPLPDWDFSVPGVTSISADLHKYGYAPKGASLMLLRDRALLKHQTFTFSGWERGTYVSNTAQGTRAGGAVAAAWAVMNFLGKDGFRHWAQVIMDTVEKLTRGINAIPGLAVLEPHELCLFVYRSTDPALDIGQVAEGLTQRGWFVGRQAEPPGIHMHLNPVHAETADLYLADLAESVEDARRVKAMLPTARPVGQTY